MERQRGSMGCTRCPRACDELTPQCLRSLLCPSCPCLLNPQVHRLPSSVGMDAPGEGDEVARSTNAYTTERGCVQQHTQHQVPQRPPCPAGTAESSTVLGQCARATGLLTHDRRCVCASARDPCRLLPGQRRHEPGEQLAGVPFHVPKASMLAVAPSCDEAADLCRCHWPGVWRAAAQQAPLQAPLRASGMKRTSSGCRGKVGLS